MTLLLAADREFIVRNNTSTGELINGKEVLCLSYFSWRSWQAAQDATAILHYPPSYGLQHRRNHDCSSIGQQLRQDASEGIKLQ
jgi:hypothetical protein